MDTTIKTIGLIVKNRDQSVIDTLQLLYEHLDQHKYEILLDSSADGILEKENSTTVDRDTLGSKSQLVIVIGGDGTLLNAARSLAPHDTPILGVNLGRLGFLADVSPNVMIDIIDHVLQGEYTEEKRFLLTASVVRCGVNIKTAAAFNDVIVHVRDVARMIDFSTYIDDKFVNHQRADGLIISTPTGSTAYALSSGGPLIHPSLEAIVLVPICPHTLSNRPIVVDSKNKVEIVISEANQSTPQLSWDGQSALDLQANDHIIIERHAHDVHMIHPSNYDYYEILRAKLRWSEQL